jgi:hypothetical protein
MRCESGPTASVASGVLAAAIGTTDLAQHNKENFKGKLSPLRLLLKLVEKITEENHENIRTTVGLLYRSCVREYPSVTSIRLGLLGPRRWDR